MQLAAQSRSTAALRAAAKPRTALVARPVRYVAQVGMKMLS